MIGAAKAAFGKLVGDVKLQVDGKSEQLDGPCLNKVQNAAGGATDSLKR